MKHAKGGFLTIALFALAATLLVFSVVGSSQAALTYFSETYGAEVSMQDIGVTLLENGAEVSRRDYSGSNDQWEGNSSGKLVSKMLNTGAEGAREDLKLGRKYDEVLAVQNTGSIDEYVRVTLYKYWADASGRKQPQLDSDLIDLELTLGSGWYEDEASRTDERTVLYYEPILAAGATTPPFTGKLEIEDEGVQADVLKRVISTDAAGNRTVETYYTYNGMQFVLRADVDAVQTHNAPEAKMSAWGTQG